MASVPQQTAAAAADVPQPPPTEAALADVRVLTAVAQDLGDVLCAGEDLFVDEDVRELREALRVISPHLRAQVVRLRGFLEAMSETAVDLIVELGADVRGGDLPTVPEEEAAEAAGVGPSAAARPEDDASPRARFVLQEIDLLDLHEQQPGVPAVSSLPDLRGPAVRTESGDGQVVLPPAFRAPPEEERQVVRDDLAAAAAVQVPGSPEGSEHVTPGAFVGVPAVASAPPEAATGWSFPLPEGVPPGTAYCDLPAKAAPAALLAE